MKINMIFWCLLFYLGIQGVMVVSSISSFGFLKCNLVPWNPRYHGSVKYIKYDALMCILVPWKNPRYYGSVWYILTGCVNNQEIV